MTPKHREVINLSWFFVNRFDQETTQDTKGNTEEFWSEIFIKKIISNFALKYFCHIHVQTLIILLLCDADVYITKVNTNHRAWATCG